VQPYRQCLPPKVLAIPETFINLNAAFSRAAAAGSVVSRVV
jgi:hypothetical protein